MLWVSGKMLLLPQRSFKQRWRGSDVTTLDMQLSKLKLRGMGCLGHRLYCTEDEEHKNWFLNLYVCDVAHLKYPQKNVLCSFPVSHLASLMAAPHLTTQRVRAAVAVHAALVAFASAVTAKEKGFYSPRDQWLMPSCRIWSWSSLEHLQYLWCLVTGFSNVCISLVHVRLWSVEANSQILTLP